MKHNYDKLRTSLRYWLLGKEWHNAHKAMEFGEKYHTGIRKDGVTREFEHQIFQAHLGRTYHKNLLFPQETMSLIFLHDIAEDYDVSHEELVKLFGKLVADSVFTMTKVYRGSKKDNTVYYEGIAECALASICKGTDRLHNLSSMDGVFKLEKQEEYIRESEEFVLPMLKKARRNFPEQELVYETIKLFIKQQISLYQSMHKLIKNQNS